MALMRAYEVGVRGGHVAAHAFGERVHTFAADEPVVGTRWAGRDGRAFLGAAAVGPQSVRWR